MSILFTAAIAAVLVTLGDLETLADTTVLLLLFVFIGVHVALLALRRTPVDHDHFRAWTILPYLGSSPAPRSPSSRSSTIPSSCSGPAACSRSAWCCG